MIVRDLSVGDLPACVELNNDAVPAVGDTDLDRLTALMADATVYLAVEHDGALAGFCLTFRPGAVYASPNYRWFCERYEDFVYLDRIVVAPDARNLGAGAALYAELETRILGTPWLCCEVNLRPRNDGSLRFHHRLGFTEVGQQETPYGTLVSMLVKPLG